MDFNEIVDMIDNTSSYIELYDCLAYIENNDLRNEINNKVADYEKQAKPLEEACKYIIKILGENICIDSKESLISAIESTGNDKDLVNLLDELEKSKKFDDKFVEDLFQLFKNNRFTDLTDKKATLVRFVQENNQALNESKNISNRSFKEILNSNERNVSEIDAENIERNNNETLDLLKKRIGQQMSVGELNSVLQGLFGQYNKVFLLLSDLYNKELDVTQTIEITEDDATFVLYYDIIDMDKGIVEIKNASIKEREGNN